MAEAWLNHLCGDRFEAQSAGLTPGTLNPLVVRAMAEVGIDISANQTRSVFDVFKTGVLFSAVIAVCDATAAERCPTFPGAVTRLQWSFPDPSKVEGDDEQQMAQVREIRDAIRDRVSAWCGEDCGVEELPDSTTVT
jgi:arsenate reductase